MILAFSVTFNGLAHLPALLRRSAKANTFTSFIVDTRSFFYNLVNLPLVTHRFHVGIVSVGHRQA